MREMYIPICITMAIYGILFDVTHAVNNYEQTILDKLEELRNRMCHSIDKYDLPPLDPFKYEETEFKANNEYLTDFSGSFSDLSLIGLSNFVVEKLIVDDRRNKKSIIEISFPLLEFETNYTMDGYLFNVAEIFGDGKAEITVKNLFVHFSGILDMSGCSLSMRGVDVKITVDDISMTRDKVFKDDEVDNFARVLFDRFGPQVVNGIWQKFQEDVKKKLQQEIRELLQNVTCTTLLGLAWRTYGYGSADSDDLPPADCKTIIEIDEEI